MKRIPSIVLAAVLALAATPAQAYCTWESIGASGASGKATCTAATDVVTETVAYVAYAAGTTYGAGAQVIYDGNPYVSLQASNTGHTPSTSTTWWALSGVSLANATTINLVVCAASFVSGSSSTTYVDDGGTIDFYYWDARVGKMAKTDISITVPAGSSGVGCSSSKGDSPGWGIPVIARTGRLVPVPNTLSASDGGSVVIEALITNATGLAL